MSSKEDVKSLIRAAQGHCPGAGHFCHAYRLFEKPTDSYCAEYASDDGEPAGTAGRPILSCVAGANLVNVAVVVARYYGGVKLGAGGLVRAYAHIPPRAPAAPFTPPTVSAARYAAAANAALSTGDVVSQRVEVKLRIQHSHGDSRRVAAALSALPEVRTLSTNYDGDGVVVELAAPPGAATDALVADLWFWCVQHCLYWV